MHLPVGLARAHVPGLFFAVQRRALRSFLPSTGSDCSFLHEPLIDKSQAIPVVWVRRHTIYRPKDENELTIAGQRCHFFSLSLFPFLARCFRDL